MSDRTLPGELAAEISRVTQMREHYRAAQQDAGPQANFAPALFMMDGSLEAAIAAASSPDIVGQVRALEDLRGYSA